MNRIIWSITILLAIVALLAVASFLDGTDTIPWWDSPLPPRPW